MLERNDHILFIGDSITHAHRRPEEYHDCYSLGGGFAKMVTAALTLELEDFNFRISNRGECGDGTADLDRRWEADCLNLKPSVISILIGINDAHPAREAGDVAQFIARYQRLLDRAIAALPGVRLVLVEPFGLWIPQASCPVTTITPEQLSTVLQYGPAVERLAERNGAVFVPTQSALRSASETGGASRLMFDGVHPSAAGHLVIARQWLNAVTAGRIRLGR
jgi:acyl-CoA thioesterase I